MAKDKVGRNDPCPCGSGKKYKKCCQKKTEKGSRITEEFPEEVVLSELLKSSKEFQAFYEAERGKITRPITWIQDASLPDGIDYEARKLPAGDLIVALKRIPAILEDATSIAHELEHFIIDAEGFPSTTSKSKVFIREQLSSTLNSVFHDPLVDSRLKMFGFDLWTDYEKEKTEAISDLEGAYCPPPNHPVRILWMLHYVSDWLDWDLRNKAEHNENQYQLWFNTHFPAIAKEGQEMLTLVQRIGFDTPDKMGILLNEIIQKYELTWLVVVKPEPQRDKIE